MQVIVLGGQGYIGTSVVDFLRKNNIEAYPCGSRIEDYRYINSYELDKYDAIILLAGHSSVPSCKGDLKGPWNNNVRNFVELVEKVDKNKPIIYASSSSVYGNTQGKFAVESDVCVSYFNNYDLTKIALDQYALNYINSGRQILGFRFGTVNGSSLVIRTELLVNSMTYSAFNTRKIHITNRDILRPFLDINDLSRAMHTVLTKGVVPGLYNLASGNQKIIEYAKAVQVETDAIIIDHGTTHGVYDFGISSKKFEKTYDFKFEGRVDNIVKGLLKSYTDQKSILVNRNDYFDYKN